MTAPRRTRGLAAKTVEQIESRWFVKNYGHQAWELDALSPVVLRERVANCIRANIDLEYWARCEVIERAERESLVEVMAGWRYRLA
jgi:hypothetical protein